MASRATNAASRSTFVYTAMHGVGFPFAQRAFTQSFGFPAAHFVPVPEQKEPDPDFPTVKFPNPEEKGALKLAMKEAEAGASKAGKKAAVVVANDPDADRFCAAEFSG